MKKGVLLLIAAGLAAASLTCSPTTYVLRAGIEEARILSRRLPIEQVVRDPATNGEVRAKLRLVLQARTFAREVLGLDVGDSYTTYSWIDRDTLALVLSAAYRDRFEPVTWWFPIVGRVPYKGFFSADDAQDAARDLESEGFDVYVRPTSAFSTLGWFNDPLLSTLLRYDDVSLVSTVIHELAHNTLFVPSRVSFNESFANFVGDRGAVAFFCGIEGEDGVRCLAAKEQWSDNLLFGRFLTDLITELEAVYARTELTPEQRIAMREAVFARARERFVREYEPRFSRPGYRGIARMEPNNARLIAWRLYYDRLDLFDAALARHGGDLRTTIDAIRSAAAGNDGDPFLAVARLGDTG
ncbi:MAG TPA: aminopeptidase [Longimicrobiales bacterium]